ncbi:MAG: adenylate/guanylate cyclase domain-containing protein [Armatimonadetes bacterium]|nr:adenylate/guanylate cyclase domain-containing protein [Armatimonadota bacterium]
MAAQRKLAAILFAEVAGPGQRTRGEDAEAERRRQARQTLRACAEAHGGRVVNSIGDSVMVAFASAVGAVDCALDIQRRMAELAEETPRGPLVRARVGIHVGDVVEEEDDLFGDTVGIARRVQDAAPPGGICITREALAQAASARHLRCAWRPTRIRDPRMRRVPVFRVRRGEERRLAPTRPREGERLTLGQAQRSAGRPYPHLADPVESWAAPLLALGAGSFGLAAYWGVGAHWESWTAAMAAFGLGSFLAGTGAAVVRAARAIRGGKPPRDLDSEILAKVRELGAVPEGVAQPLSRALGAYAAISQAGRDPGWGASGIPIRSYVRQARAQLLALLERGRQLGRVGGALQHFAQGDEVPADFQKVADLYRHHQARLAGAAEVFEQAEAGLLRGLLAMTSKPPGAAARDESLREMGAAFAALAEVLESLEELPVPSALTPHLPPPDEEGAEQRLRRLRGPLR